MSAVLDTHTALWSVFDRKRISQTALQAIRRSVSAGKPLLLSAISLVAAIYLVERGRIPLESSRRISKRRCWLSGFKETYPPGKNPSADVLHEWAEEHNFVWLISEDILDESKEVLKRLRVRSHLIGGLVNLIRNRAEDVKVRYSIEISPDSYANIRYMLGSSYRS